MGNLSSTSNNDGASSSPSSSHHHHGLALLAVSNTMTITQSQILQLRKNCMIGSLGQKRTRPKISRASFQKAMIRSHISSKQDWNILQHLFTMWDEQGEERVDFVEFLTGISLVACEHVNSLQQVLVFAMHVMENVHKKTSTQHCISKTKLEKLLNGTCLCHCT